MKKLTTHVLDTANGKPGANIKVELFLLDGDSRTLLKTTTTNSDGRTDAPLLDEAEFALGQYELVFHIAEYFQLAEDAFLTCVPLRFSMNEAAHYHVPLLCSPWSYSTYRGS
ncbi:MAG: hydroxyisourate hydrolase [Gammaproteobacteria bacterium]|nr:hydroxyisourate hydrolase [Gammaproteobacteria bacterium]